MKHSSDKCWAVILTAALFLLLGACGGAEKTTTYAELSEENRQIVDFVYSNLSQWETSDTSEVTFKKSEGETTLVTFDLDTINYGTRNWFGYTNSYAVDADSGCFDREDSSYIGHSAYTTSHGMEKQEVIYTRVWDVDWTESEKKDYLAHKLADDCASIVGYGIVD